MFYSPPSSSSSPAASPLMGSLPLAPPSEMKSFTVLSLFNRRKCPNSTSPSQTKSRKLLAKKSKSSLKSEHNLGYSVGYSSGTSFDMDSNALGLVISKTSDRSNESESDQEWDPLNSSIASKRAAIIKQDRIMAQNLKSMGF